MLLSRDEDATMGKAELKAVETAAHFLGKQMEHYTNRCIVHHGPMRFMEIIEQVKFALEARTTEHGKAGEQY